MRVMIPPCNGRCCPTGKVCSNGVCQGIGCFETDGVTPCSSSNCICKYGEQVCGIGCDAKGLSCVAGFCTSSCLEGTSYGYDSDKKLYGCITTNAPSGLSFFCTKYGQNKHCSLINQPVNCGIYCNLDGSNCAYGACKENPCISLPDAKNYTFELASPAIGYGCQKDGIVCIRGSCYLNHQNCATNCSKTPWRIDTCDPNSCGNNPCPTGFTVSNVRESGTIRCTNADNTLYCQHTIGNEIECYSKRDGTFKRCGWSCQLNGTGCDVGMCTENLCPSGTTVTHIASSFEADGCLTKYTTSTGEYELACLKVGTSIRCYRDAAVCFYNCDSYKGEGENCSQCHDGPQCPTGMWATTYYDFSGWQQACTDGLVICLFSGRCFYNGLLCGTGCQLDGSSCSSGTICKCPENQEINYINNQYVCTERQSVVCKDTACSFGNYQCGTECTSNNPSACQTGVCDESICTSGTVLKRASFQYYGCYSATNETICYKEDTGFTCFNQSNVCGVNCQVDGTGCAKGQTCIADEAIRDE